MSSENVRRLGAYALVSAVALIAWGAQQGGDVVVDGSFEDGSSAWELAPGARVVFAGKGAWDGSHVLELDMPPEAGPDVVLQAFAAQTLELEPWREYELTYRYQRSFAEKKLRLPVTLHEHSPYHVVTRSYMSETSPDVPWPVADGWHAQSARFFAHGATAPLQIGPLTFPDGPLEGGRVWIDDVRVVALGSHREAGVDHDYAATLPSDAVVGEPVEVHVACRDTRGKQGGFRVRGMPVPSYAEIGVVPSHPSVDAPSSVQFEGEVQRTFMATFHAPGIHRLRLAHANGHATWSNPVNVAAEAPAERRYWGDLHVHTQYNHGGWVSGDGYENYWYARDVARLDFAALTEHFPQSAALPYVHQMSDAAELYHEPGSFVTFFGSERGVVEGHHNTYLRGDDRFEMNDPRHQKFDTERDKLAFYRAQGTPVLSFPHHFSLLDPTDWRLADRDARAVVEIYSDHGSSEAAGEWWRHPDHDGNDYSATMGAEGHDYLSALARGHRLGVTAASDDHFARPGLHGLTCVSAPALERGPIWDGIRSRRCYATTGARVLLEFEVNGRSMGGEAFAEPGTPITAAVRASGTAPLAAVEIVSGGEVVHSVAPGAFDWIDEAIPLGTFSGETTWFYARVRQADEHRAWSSPVWVAVPEADLVVEPKDVEYDHAASTLTVRAQNYGDREASASVRLFTSARHHALEAEQLLGDELGVVLTVRPRSELSSLVEVYLYIPADHDETFDFSGEIRLTGASGYEVVTDPRGMLVDEGGGTISWDEGPYGYKTDGSASHSGRISDFAILVHTAEETHLAADFAANGAPVPDCRVGGLPSGVPGSLEVALGTVAAETETAEEPIAVPAGGPPAEVLFPGLAPGNTYVVVVDPDDAVVETDERNNDCAVAVPAAPEPAVLWPDVPVPPPLPELEVRPKTAGMSLNDSLQLRAFARYPDGFEVDATHVVEWVPDAVFDALLTLGEDGRVRSGGYEASARVHARLTLGEQSVRSDDALVWATERVEPRVLSAGYRLTYLDEGNPSEALTVTARVAQRDDFALGAARVTLHDADGSPWTPHGAPLVLRDDGLAGDVEAGDGIHTIVVDPAPQASDAAFGAGDNLKLVHAQYLAGSTSHAAVVPWPFHLEGPHAAYPIPGLDGPEATPDAEAYVGPRVVSAGTRGFGGVLPAVAGDGAPQGPAGPAPFAPIGGPSHLFLEVEVAPPADPLFAGAPTRVVALLPWSSTPVELTPTPGSPGVHHLLVRTHPQLLPDGLHRIDVRAESFLLLGGKGPGWWSSDWWPRLRLHEFLADEP